MSPQALHPEPVGTWARNHRAGGPDPDGPFPPAAGRGEAASPHSAFTLVELLVVVSIIIVLMGMVAAGMAGARSDQKKQLTQALIARIDRVIQQQYSSYASRVVVGATSSADRAEKLRRLARFEMPDNWADVELIASGSAGVGMTSAQRTYKTVWDNLASNRKVKSSDEYVGKKFGDAECLFMMVMWGGIADCLDCGDLAKANFDDMDGDELYEFLDAWGNPIRYVFSPAAFERPLIYSGGPTKLDATIPADGSGIPTGAITNFDQEMGK